MPLEIEDPVLNTVVTFPDDWDDERIKFTLNNLRMSLPQGQLPKGSLAEGILKFDILPTAGAITGGIIGGFGGMGLGSVPGGIAGATVGGMAGEGAEQLYRRFVGSEKGAQPPQSSSEAAKDLALRGVAEGATEWGGAKVGLKFVEWLGHSKAAITDAGQRAMMFMRDVMGTSERPSVAQLTDSPLLDVIENATEGGLLGGLLRSSKIKTQDALTKWGRSLSQKMFGRRGLTSYEAAQELSKILKDNKRAFKLFGTAIRMDMLQQASKINGLAIPIDETLKAAPREVGGFLKELELLVPPPQVLNKEVSETITKIDKDTVEKVTEAVAESARGTTTRSATATKTRVDKETIEKMLTEEKVFTPLDRIPDELSPTAAIGQLRSRIKEEIRDLSKKIELGRADSGDKLKLRNLINAQNKLEESIQSSLPEDLFRLHQRANAVYNGGYKRFEDEFITAAFLKATGKGAKPEEFLAEFKVPGGVERLDALLKAVKGLKFPNNVTKDGTDIARATLLEGVIDENFKINNETLNAWQLTESLLGKGSTEISGLGREWIRTLFKGKGPQHVKNFEEFLNALQVTQRANPTGVGSAAMQFAQIGALVTGGGALMSRGLGLLSDEGQQTLDRGAVMYGGAIVLGPKALARLLTSDLGLKLLTVAVKDGATTQPMSVLEAQIGARATSLIARIAQLNEVLYQAEQNFFTEYMIYNTEGELEYRMPNVATPGLAGSTEFSNMAESALRSGNLSP